MKKDSGKKKSADVTDTSLYSQNETIRGFSVYNSEGNAYYKGEVEKMVRELRQELYPPMPPRANTQLPQYGKNVRRPLYVKKKAPLVLIFLFNLIALAIIVLSCFDLGKFGVAIATFIKDTTAGSATAVSLFDGLFFQLARLKLSLPMTAQLAYGCDDTMAKVALGVFAVMGPITAILTLVQMVRALVVLFRGRDKKKAHFGLISFLTLVTIVLTMLSIVILKAELGFGDMCSLFFLKDFEKFGALCGLPRADEGYTLYSGYGFYALVLVPILTMICSACIYRKQKERR